MTLWFREILRFREILNELSEDSERVHSWIQQRPKF